MIRSLFLIVALLWLIPSIHSKAQSRQVPNKPEYDQAPYHFGFLLGVNQMYFTLKTNQNYQKHIYYNNNLMQSIPDQDSDSAYVYSIEAAPTTGFVIGIVSDLRMGNYFDLRFTPSLTFGERYIYYSLRNFYSSSQPSPLMVTKNIQSTFVEFPLWVKYKGQRIHNVRPYILAGGKWSLDLASNAKKKKDNHLEYIFINRKDFYALGGVGFDFYTPYFKFGTELTMSYGLFDVLKRDATIYTREVKKMSSKMFQISFTFE